MNLNSTLGSLFVSLFLMEVGSKITFFPQVNDWGDLFLQSNASQLLSVWTPRWELWLDAGIAGSFYMTFFHVSDE